MSGTQQLERDAATRRQGAPASPSPRRSSSAPTAGGPRSPTTTPSSTSAAAPRPSPSTWSTRGEQATGIVIAYDRRFASEHFAAAAAEVVLAHDIPIAFAAQAVPTQMSSFEVVQREAAAGIVITASHNPWTDNGFKIKSPTGAAAGPGDARPTSRRGSPPDAGTADRRAAVRRRRGGRPGRALRLVRRLPRSSSRRNLDLDRLRAADMDLLVDPLYGSGVDAGSRGCWPAARSASRRSTPSATRTSAASTPSRSRRTSNEALADDRRRRLRPGPAPRRRRGPRRARPTSAARSSPRSRSSPC